MIQCSRCKKTLNDEGVTLITSMTRTLPDGTQLGDTERECNLCADLRRSEAIGQETGL